MPVTTVRLSEDLNEDIEDLLGYNDTKSDWLREAAEEKLERDRGGPEDRDGAGEDDSAEVDPRADA